MVNPVGGAPYWSAYSTYNTDSPVREGQGTEPTNSNAKSPLDVPDAPTDLKVGLVQDGTNVQMELSWDWAGDASDTNLSFRFGCTTILNGYDYTEEQVVAMYQRGTLSFDRAGDFEIDRTISRTGGVWPTDIAGRVFDPLDPQWRLDPGVFLVKTYWVVAVAQNSDGRSDVAAAKKVTVAPYYLNVGPVEVENLAVRGTGDPGEVRIEFSPSYDPTADPIEKYEVSYSRREDYDRGLEIYGEEGVIANLAWRKITIETSDPSLSYDAARNVYSITVDRDDWNSALPSGQLVFGVQAVDSRQAYDWVTHPAPYASYELMHSPISSIAHLVMAEVAVGNQVEPILGLTVDGTDNVSEFTMSILEPVSADIDTYYIFGKKTSGWAEACSTYSGTEFWDRLDGFGPGSIVPDWSVAIAADLMEPLTGGRLGKLINPTVTGETLPGGSFTVYIRAKNTAGDYSAVTDFSQVVNDVFITSFYLSPEIPAVTGVAADGTAEGKIDITFNTVDGIGKYIVYLTDETVDFSDPLYMEKLNTPRLYGSIGLQGKKTYDDVPSGMFHGEIDELDDGALLPGRYKLFVVAVRTVEGYDHHSLVTMASTDDEVIIGQPVNPDPAPLPPQNFLGSLGSEGERSVWFSWEEVTSDVDGSPLGNLDQVSHQIVPDLAAYRMLVGYVLKSDRDTTYWCGDSLVNIDPAANTNNGQVSFSLSLTRLETLAGHPENSIYQWKFAVSSLDQGGNPVTDQLFWDDGGPAVTSGLWSTIITLPKYFNGKDAMLEPYVVPNPIKGQSVKFVNLPPGQPSTIGIYDLSGWRLEEIVTDGDGIYEWHLPDNFKKGVYFYQVNDGKVRKMAYEGTEASR